jgi:pentatricopeptide repeat protein
MNSKRFSKNVALYDIVTMNMIMEVIIRQQTDLSKAPLVAQSIFDFILENGKKHSKEYEGSYNDDEIAESNNTTESEFQIKPNIFTYGLLLTSWANSGLPNAGIKMEDIIDEMHRDTGAPNPSAGTYGTLLRYYSHRGEVAHLHRILQRMSHENVQPNIDSYANVLYCCCKNLQISKAAFIMNMILMEVDQYELRYQRYIHDPDFLKHDNKMLGINDFSSSDHLSSATEDEYTLKAVHESIFNMLVAYRDAVVSPSSSRELISQHIKDAEQLVARLQKNSFIIRKRNESKSYDSKFKKYDLFDRISNVLMVMYARADRIHDAEVLFAKSSSTNDLRYLSLIHAYVARHLPERGTALLHRMLKDKNLVTMNSSCFAAVTDAWADAAERNNIDALKNAIQIVQLMDTSERCKQLNVRPCVAVFNGVLKCLSNIKAPSAPSQSPSAPDIDATDAPLDPCQTAIEILDEMEERSKTFKAAAPNIVSYTLVIKTCLRNNKLELADEMLRRMEDSNTPPDLRTYSDILSHYSTLGTEASAKQTENVFEYIKYLSMEKPSLKPDIVCYSILLNAWINANSGDTTEHVWRIYKMMHMDGIEMDNVFASRVISYLTTHGMNTSLCYDQTSTSAQQQDYFASPVGLESSMNIPLSTPINLQRAVMILDEMARNTFMSRKPNERLYKFVIKGFISIGDLVTATSLLLRMIESYINGSNTNAKPSEHLMSIVVMAWVSYGDLIKATLLLNKLAELYCSKQTPVGPDMGTYRTLIAHWNRSLHPKKEHYLAQLQYHMMTLSQATNPSLGVMESFNSNTTYDNAASTDRSESSSPQTFLATALAALKRQS